MAEIGVQLPFKRKCRGSMVQSVVCLRVVLHRTIRQACEELIRESHALCWSQGIAIRKAVVLVQSFIVIVAMPLRLGEESAEERRSAVIIGHGVERAKVHHIDRLASAEIGAWQVSIEPCLDWGHKYLRPRPASIVADVAVGAVLKIGAQSVAQRVVEAFSFILQNDWVREPIRGGRLVALSCRVKSFSPAQC